MNLGTLVHTNRKLCHNQNRQDAGLVKGEARHTSNFPMYATCLLLSIKMYDQSSAALAGKTSVYLIV